jgi:hypothetical protein
LRKGRLVQEIDLVELDPVTERGQVLVAGGTGTDDAGHLVAGFQQQLREERAVLAADARDQSTRHRSILAAASA